MSLFSAWKAVLPTTIVARTTLTILMLALLASLLFGSGAALALLTYERRHQETGLNELLSTVENTTSIAVFVHDAALAHEVGTGLMGNGVVSGVRILADDGAPLYEAGTHGAGTLSIRRPIHSPFANDEVIGEMVLSASEAVLRDHAWQYTRYVLLVLGLALGAIALAVAWVVSNLITRPIKGISDELHRMELRTGMRLRLPPHNREDELGRLVVDVNALIGRLTQLIDDERTLRLEREASERRLAQIFDKVDAGIFEVDRSGRLQSWNPAFVRTLGAPQTPATLQALLPEHAQPALELIRDSLEHAQPRERDLEVRTADGRTLWIEMSLTPVDRRMLQGVINDITERKQTELAAQQMAARDTLTGLLNRRGFDASLDAVFARRQREPQLTIVLMMIDLDYFKQVNDTHGHSAGDVVLQRVARLIEQAVRRTDVVSRPGGDEFAVALVGIDDADHAERIARTLIDAIRRPIALGNGAQAHIGASIGIALVGADESSAAAALQRADEAMYAAKQAGRCRVVRAPAPQQRPHAGAAA